VWRTLIFEPACLMDRGVRSTTARPTAPRRARPAKRVAIAARSVASFLTLLPLGANANETCQRLDLVTPAQYETKTITVTYEAHERLIVVPATYKMIEQEVVVAESYCPGEILVEERITAWEFFGESPAPRLQTVPTTFKRVDIDGSTRRFVVEDPSSVVWRPNNGYPARAIIKVRPHDSKLSCTDKELIQAETRSIERRVEDVPATTRSERVPERTQMITERVIVKPAHVTIHQEPCNGK